MSCKTTGFVQSDRHTHDPHDPMNLHFPVHTASLPVFSRHTRCSADQAPYQSLFGPPALEDRLGDLRLLVSPDSFLQVNPPAAEELYRVVEERVRLTPVSVLLDLCAGTGEMGLDWGRDRLGSSGGQ